MRAYVDNILKRIGVNGRELKYTLGSEPVFSASMSIDTRSGKHIGSIGIVAKPVLKMFDLKQPVIYSELCWGELVKMALRNKVTYAPLPRTMAVKRDLALLVDTSVSMAQIEQAVRESDVYEGKNLPEGKKSYAITMTLQDDEKTLNDKQIDAVMNKIIANVTKKTGAVLR